MHFHQLLHQQKKNFIFSVVVTGRIKGGYEVLKLLHNCFAMQKKLHKTPHFKMCFLLLSFIKTKAKYCMIYWYAFCPDQISLSLLSI